MVPRTKSRCFSVSGSADSSLAPPEQLQTVPLCISCCSAGQRHQHSHRSDPHLSPRRAAGVAVIRHEPVSCIHPNTSHQTLASYHQPSPSKPPPAHPWPTRSLIPAKQLRQLRYHFCMHLQSAMHRSIHPHSPIHPFWARLLRRMVFKISAAREQRSQHSSNANRVPW